MQWLKAFRNKSQPYLLVILIALNVLVWVLVLGERESDVLSVYFLNVGQGDAVLIETPSKARMLIDGGKNRLVLSELGKVLPFGERRIDVVLATHPDADHIGGLPEVVARYDVGAFIEPDAVSKNSINSELHKRLDERNIPRILARRGMVVDFGRGAKLVVLFPDRDVKGADPNDASIVAKLVYGEQSFLLTGDAELLTENILLSANEALLDSDVLKAGHHGSRTSSSLSFLNAVTPEYAVISAGKDNSYSHPHQEVINNLEKVGAVILGTATHGTIVFQTDGKTLELK